MILAISECISVFLFILLHFWLSLKWELAVKPECDSNQELVTLMTLDGFLETIWRDTIRVMLATSLCVDCYHVGCYPFQPERVGAFPIMFILQLIFVSGSSAQFPGIGVGRISTPRIRPGYSRVSRERTEDAF